MNTLAKLILDSPRHRILLAPPGDPGPDPEDGASTPCIPVIVADAASEFFFAGTPREHWEFHRDFPRCIPPGSPLFLEMARPSRSTFSPWALNLAGFLPPRWGWRLQATPRHRLAGARADGRRLAMRDYYGRYLGWLGARGPVDLASVVAALESPDPPSAARGLDRSGSAYFAASAIVRALDGLASDGEDSRDDRWGLLLHGDLLIDGEGEVIGPAATLDVLLDHHGRPMYAPLIDAHGHTLEESMVEVLRAGILVLTFPAFLALSFMNAKGVALPDDPSSDLGRRGVRDQVSTSHRVLDIAGVAGLDRN